MIPLIFRGEALCALREAVQMAHESNDDVCLQHAQTWLYRLSRNNKVHFASFSVNVYYSKDNRKF